MPPQMLLNLGILLLAAVLIIWFPDKVALVPMILSKVVREDRKPSDATRERAAVPPVAKLPEVDPNKTVVMPPRDRPDAR